jgi:hypothetical protein
MTAFSSSSFYSRHGNIINPFNDSNTFGSFGLGHDEKVIQAAIDKGYETNGIQEDFIPRLPGANPL